MISEFGGEDAPTNPKGIEPIPVYFADEIRGARLQGVFLGGAICLVAFLIYYHFQSPEKATQFVTRPEPRYEFRPVSPGFIWRVDRHTGEAWWAVLGDQQHWTPVQGPLDSTNVLNAIEILDESHESKQ